VEREYFIQQFIELATKYAEESSKLDKYLPDFRGSPESVAQWYKVIENQLNFSNQRALMKQLYADLYQVWIELSNTSEGVNLNFLPDLTKILMLKNH
jgi:hypothetical protein